MNENELLLLAYMFGCSKNDICRYIEEFNEVAVRFCKGFAESNRTRVPTITKESTRSAIDNVLRKLTPREEKVINMRFGLPAGEPMTQDAIGRYFAVTGSRISQIQKKALGKLRRRPLLEAFIKNWFTL